MWFWRDHCQVQWQEKCPLSLLRLTLVLVLAVFAPDTLPIAVEQLPQAKDQDNPIPLGLHQVVNADTELCLDSMLNNFQDVCQLMELQDLDPVSPVQVKGRLKENIAFWKDTGASKWVLSVIENSYYLPFISLPVRRSFQNQEFVCQELKKLLASGAVVEVKQEDVLVVNPVEVVKNASGKSRLILDLRYVNNHLRACKFKYEGIPAASELFQKDDWVLTFVYKSGYHHLDIFVGHTTFLGCSFQLEGKLRYFEFTVLPFGLATGLMCSLKSREL